MTEKAKLARLEAALEGQHDTMKRQGLLRQIWREKRDADQELVELDAKSVRRREQSDQPAGLRTLA